MQCRDFLKGAAFACFCAAVLVAPADEAWEAFSRKCLSNVGKVKTPVKGLVIEHHGSGCGRCGRTQGKAVTDFARFRVEDGWVFVHPRTESTWTNDSAVRLTDDLVGAIIAHYGLRTDVPILSTGYSMGGHGALVWPVFSKYRRNIRAVFANCPVTDLPVFHAYVAGLTNGWARYDRQTVERSYPAEAGVDYEKVLRRRSPIHLVDRLPDVPYYVNQGTADKCVQKATQSDVFVPALKAAGRKVVYFVSEGSGHIGFSKTVRPQWEAALQREMQEK